MARPGGGLDQEKDWADAWLAELLHCPKGCSCLSHWPGTQQSGQRLSHATSKCSVAEIPVAGLPRTISEPPVADIPVAGLPLTATLPVELEPADPDHENEATASLNQTLDMLLASGAPCRRRIPVAPPASSPKRQCTLQPCVSHLRPDDPCEAPACGASHAASGAAHTQQWHPDIFDATNPKLQNAGKAMAHCENLVSRVIEGGLTVFKIGVACDPNGRWTNKQFGYLWDDDFKHMMLLHQDETRACGFLESALISKFGQTCGCRNVAPGGEGIRKFQPNIVKLVSGSPAVSYVYIVFKHLPKRPPARPMAAKSCPPHPLPY